jgi:hypothetical protein
MSNDGNSLSQLSAQDRLILGIISAVFSFIFVGMYYGDPSGTPEQIELKKVREAADERFNEVSKVTPENAERWGLTSFRVYGYHLLTRRSLDGETITTIPDTPDGKYEVLIPCCCKGTLPDGTFVNRVQHVHLVVPRSTGDKFVAELGAITVLRDVTMTDRIGWWFQNSLLMPIRVFLITLVGWVLWSLVVSFSLTQAVGAPIIALFGSRYFGVVHGAYMAYVSGGSGWMAILVLAALYALTVLIVWVALLIAIKMDWINPTTKAYY